MTDEKLRQQLRILKAIGQIDNLGEVSEMIGISKASFYNWLSGAYSLSSAKKRELTNLVNDLSID